MKMSHVQACPERFFGPRKQDLPLRPSTRSSDEADAEVEGPIPVETVSTKKLAVSPQSSSLGEPS